MTNHMEIAFWNQIYRWSFINCKICSLTLTINVLDKIMLLSYRRQEKRMKKVSISHDSLFSMHEFVHQEKLLVHYKVFIISSHYYFSSKRFLIRWMTSLCKSTWLAWWRKSHKFSVTSTACPLSSTSFWTWLLPQQYDKSCIISPRPSAKAFILVPCMLLVNHFLPEQQLVVVGFGN